MSLINNIDHLARAPGVVSILVDAGAMQAHRGEHHEAQRLALLLRDELNVDQIGIAAGPITIMVQREPGGTAAVVVETGHEIRKSLRRMIRRAARAEGRKSDRAAAIDAVMRPALDIVTGAWAHLPRGRPVT